MRILYFLDTLGRGGAEMQALDVARNAADFGLDLTIVSGGGGSLEEDFKASGAELIQLQRHLPVDPNIVRTVRQIIRNREIQIVHGYQPVDGIHLYLASKGLKKVKNVLSFQGFIQDWKNRSAAKFLIPRMDANIAVSRGLQKWLSANHKLDTSKNFSVIYNGADPKRLAPTGSSLRPELNIGASTPLVGMVANFYRDQRKDQLTVVKAMVDVIKRFPDIHCVFAGGVEDGAEGKLTACVDICRSNNIDDRVHFLGSRDDVPNILAELDIAILSSFHEGLPVAISEAMLAGTAMIVSDIEPHLEASGDGKYAAVFPVGDADILAQRMIDLIGDNTGRDALAQKAKSYALENLSIYSHLRDLTKLYEALIENQLADLARVDPTGQ